MGRGPDREEVIRSALAWLSEQDLSQLGNDPALRPQEPVRSGEIFHPDMLLVEKDADVTVPAGVARQAREASGLGIIDFKRTSSTDVVLPPTLAPGEPKPN